MDGGGGVVVVSSSSYPGLHQDKDDEQENFTRYMLWNEKLATWSRRRWNFELEWDYRTGISGELSWWSESVLGGEKEEMKRNGERRWCGGCRRLMEKPTKMNKMLVGLLNWIETIANWKFVLFLHFFRRELQEGSLRDNGLVDGSKIILIPNVETGLLVSQVIRKECVSCRCRSHLRLMVGWWVDGEWKMNADVEKIRSQACIRNWNW